MEEKGERQRWRIRGLLGCVRDGGTNNVTLKEKAKRKPNNTAARLHCANIQQIHGDAHSGAPKRNATEKPLMYKQQNMSSVKTAEQHIQKLSHGYSLMVWNSKVLPS